MYAVFVHILVYMDFNRALDVDEKWEIDKSELTLGRELGSGQFGVSFL